MLTGESADRGSFVGSAEALPAGERLVAATEVRMSEIMSALSVALDVTQGNRPGHCMRTALIGMRLADELRLRPADSSALFYALLLKDLGCSSNAAKMSYLFGADDRAVKHSVRMIDWTKPGECFRNGWRMCRRAVRSSSGCCEWRRWCAAARKGPGRFANPLRARSRIARMLRLPEATARAILELDEHWDGQGSPRGLEGVEISLLARICCLAQTVEVFYRTWAGRGGRRGGGAARPLVRSTPG